MTNKNLYSHLTAKQRDGISMPARYLYSKNLLKGKILDFGCGFGKDVEALQAKGLDIEGYDPHYFPPMPRKKFDTILCFYVLNVLLPEEQTEVLMNVSRYLQPSGKAYFSVRRDIVHEGFRMHALHGKPVYQCNVRLPYKSIFLNENSEIYEYQHFNQLERKPESDCVLCSPSQKLEFLAETCSWFAYLEGSAAWVVPKSHAKSYFDLTFDLQKEAWQVVNRVKIILQNRFNALNFKLEIDEFTNKGNHARIRLTSYQ
ncbi:MAG: methyltransferase domain-containing protein [Haliscomenobacter sp.]|nr:methyltransferase domain-containing protein [Haliscomenobacter sp.]